MNSRLRIPIRVKIIMSLLVALTLVVSVITFVMANMFHEDKRAYINDWISVASIGTATEVRSTLESYQRQLGVLTQVMLNEEMLKDHKTSILQKLFNEFPELIEITLHRQGEDPEVATDHATLEAAGIDVQELRQFRREHPLSLEAIRSGQVSVTNSTVVAELPCFTLAFAESDPGFEHPVVVEAWLRLDDLLQVGSRYEVFEITISAEDGAILSHPDRDRVYRRERKPIRPEAFDLMQEYQAGVTMEYVRDGVETIGGFADVGYAELVTSAEIPLSAAFLASRTLMNRLLAIALVSLITAGLGGLFWAHQITRPVERLSGATRRIARGEFNFKVDVVSRDEIGDLAGSFNQMTSELQVREEKLHAAQEQLVQSEKMAAFGQLGAGIAHEVKNPLAGILGCAQLSMMDLEDKQYDDLEANLKLIEKETTRCKTIIDNLMKFARQEKTALEPIEVNPAVVDAIAIVNHQLGMKQVSIVKELERDLPLIEGSANQLQQVLMNLMMNSQQAMEGQAGQVTVTTRRAEPDHVEIVVSDNGPGIPKEIQAKLFEPFFTTKPTGKGTGLGLSVTFGIIRDHNGKIAVESEVGHGASFIITLPASTAVAPVDEAQEAITVGG